MIYYTIQKLKAWEEAKEKGYLTGNKAYTHDFLEDAYKWMKQQMAKRLGDYKWETPIWLWMDTANINFEELLEDDYVLLEIDLDESQVLLSNFVAWHHIINDWHLDDEDNSKITKEESWEYIFDKDLLEEMEFNCEDIDMQGVVGKIDCKSIKVKKYIVSNIK